MLKRSRIRAVALSLAIAASPAATHADVLASQKSILVVSADNLGEAHLASFFAGFRDTLQKQSKPPVKVYSESLDIDAFNGPSYPAQVADWYRQKYRDVHPDAILILGQAPLQFMIQSKLWPGVPTYFALVTANGIKGLPLPANVTGQTFELSFDVVVSLAKQLFPDTEHIALVGNTPERDKYRPFRLEELRAVKNQVDFIDLRGMRYETVSARVASLPPNTVVYHTSFSDDGSGRLFDTTIALEALSRMANSPTLIDVDSSVGHGPVGGMVGLLPAQGEQAALKLSRLLKGEPPSAIPVEARTLSPVFDWRALQRWQVPDARLPPASKLLFYQPTVWQLYWEPIVGALLVIACLSALSVALLIERRRRAVAVAESRRRLAEIAHMNRNATASVYSAAIAHELNQPLAAILSNAEAAEMMLGRPNPPIEELQDILADIRRDDHRASDLIARMRNLLKPSEVNTQTVDMATLVSDALQFIAGEAKVRGTLLNTNLTSEPAPVVVDPVQMQQVLINLVLNSLDAMTDTPRSARVVTISTALLGKTRVEVKVQDTGSGFDSNIEHVFQSFFTTKAHGMGLGLSITAAIIESHGGGIDASDVPGGGACVRFHLPVKEAA
jgi:signal transduction histidine kinase